MRFLVLASLLLTLATAAQRPPNVMLLLADDLGRYPSAYASPTHPSPSDIIATPAFDRLAREGALFHNAFASAPSCTPSRAALLTGRHFFRNGSHSQLHHPWPAGTPDPFAAIKGMPLILRDAGYHIGHTYKLHLRPSIIGGTSNIYDHAGSHLNQYSRHLTTAADPAAAKQKILAQVQGNFRAFLARRTPHQPFFYSFNPTNTHRPWQSGSGQALWNLHPDQLRGKMPAALPDSPTIRQDLTDYLGEVMAFDAACAALIHILHDLGELDHTIILITGDHGIPGFPRGKCNVHDLGSRVPLAIRWPSKIAPGRHVTAPVSLIDLAPTLLAAAHLTSPDAPDGQNLLPALAPGATDTHLRGWALIGREAHVATARPGNLPYPVRALRTADFLYVKNFHPQRWPMGAPLQVTPTSAPAIDQILRDTRCAFPDIDASPTKAWLIHHRHDPAIQPLLTHAWELRPAEELYHLPADPHQLTNLATHPAHAATLATLRQQLLAELKKGQDPRLADDAFDRPPYLNVRRH